MVIPQITNTKVTRGLRRLNAKENIQNTGMLLMPSNGWVNQNTPGKSNSKTTIYSIHLPQFKSPLL